MATKGQYPFSTQDGTSVPVEIVKPQSLIFWTLQTNVNKVITIPAGYGTSYLYSSADCILQLGGTPFSSFVGGTEYLNSIYVPAFTPLLIMLNPGGGNIWPLAAGNLFVSSVEQWGSLSQDIQGRVQ